MGLIESLGLQLPKSMAGPGAAARPAAGAAPSAEAQKFTRHAKEVLAQVARLEAARSPDAARLKKTAVEAARLGQASKSRAEAAQQLQGVEKEVARLIAQAERAAKAPQEPRYTMRIGSRQLVDASAEQACTELNKALDDLERKLQNGFEKHCDLLKIQREEPFAAWISSGLTAIRGGQQMPELEIWDGARDLVIEARRCLKQREVEAIPPLFPKIAAATRAGLSKIGKYNDDAIESAGQAIEIAKKTEEASATVISKAAEKMGGKGAGIAAEAMAKSVFEGAEQWSAVHIAKTRREIDWGAVAKEGVASAAEGIVGLLLEGVLVERLSGFFGGYLSKAKFSEAELLAMGKAVGLAGPLPRDHLMTAVQKFARNFVVNKAKGLVTGIVGDLIKGKKESDPPMDLEAFAGDVAKKLASGKAIEMFADYVVEHAAEIAKVAAK